jgi:DNA-binding NtrC family response regulator
MPALREIPEDIPLIANSFVAHYVLEMKKSEVVLSPAALTCLKNYHWPGNVRELENEIKRLIVSCSGKTITEADLSEAIRDTRGGSIAKVGHKQSALKTALPT